VSNIEQHKKAKKRGVTIITYLIQKEQLNIIQKKRFVP
jgi:hypothetical protein